MREIRHDADNDLPGKVKAEKVELATQSPGERPSNSRFWRLKGINVGDLWHVALHADSQFRLRVEQEEDEHGTTIKVRFLRFCRHARGVVEKKAKTYATNTQAL